MNVLFDFYGPLLTEKQQTFLKCYFQDDYSLGEIAADFDISRQAVYEHLKRAEQALEDYESKLGLAARHDQLQAGLDKLERQITGLQPQAREDIQQTINMLRRAEA
ncbi:YlxM family DNA-binding protein [Cohnella sp. GCM10027633]|uniref:YlxM family DNA-binding protein n=1 Tax=unclassified Cohnella TaxID=2636738 RepID=UPI003626EA12